MLILYIVNDKTGTEEVGNYKYSVATSIQPLIRGELNNFKRDRGWK